MAAVGHKVSTRCYRFLARILNSGLYFHRLSCVPLRLRETLSSTLPLATLPLMSILLQLSIMENKTCHPMAEEVSTFNPPPL